MPQRAVARRSVGADLRHLAGVSGIYVAQEPATRRFVEAVLWMARAGCAWRLVPHEVGSWNSVYRRFARWQERRYLGGADRSSGGRRRSRVGDARQHRGAGHACAPGQKNRRRASAWSLAWRLLQQAARFRRQPGQPAGLPPDRRAAGRCPASPASARRSHDHSGDRRQGLRHGCHLQAVAAEGAWR